jgi:two-component sensor histidine kinase
LLTSNGAVLESVETEKENVINMYTNLTYDFIGRKGYGFHYDTVGEKFNKYSYAGIAYFKGDNKYYGLRKSKITEYLQTESNHYNINDFVYSMSEFGDDKLLLGCGSGVMKFSKKNALLDSINTVLYRTNNYYLANNIVNYAPSEPFFKSKVRDIKNIGDSLLLFGSAEQGLFIREVNKKDYWLRIKDGLISNSINRVYFNEGQILVITNSGISLIEKGKKIKNYTSDNGLLSNFVNDALIHNDTLWAATEGGTSIFPLEQKRASEIPIYLTEIKVNGQIIALKDEYELEHDENELDISIDGLSFEQEGNIKYKYRFFGADQQWIETENRTIRYSNLPSGEFIFEVKAENYSNHWTEPIVLFYLNKKQPFWEHALFLSAMVLLLIGIIWVVVWLVYRKRRRIEGDKIRILNLERKTLQAQMNPHFMFNSLNSLQNLIIKDKKREAQEYLGEFASLTRLALIQSTKNSIRLHEEIAILQHYIELEKIRYSDSFEYEIVIELIDQKIEISPMLIQPFVENAIIHGLSNKLHDGKLKITFKERNNKTIQCIIEDNGSGRKKHENPNKHKSLGISLVKERLDILLKEKAIHIEDLFADEQPKGTRVVLVLPFKKFKL